MSSEHEKHKKNGKNRKTARKRKNNKKQKYLNLLYTNPDGITGKVTRLISAAQAANAQIIGLAEAKLGKTNPAIPGYEWINKPRKNRTGGGVALLIRQDIHHLTEVIEGLEDQDQEIIWAKLENSRAKTSIGIFYGPKKNAPMRKLNGNTLSSPLK